MKNLRIKFSLRVLLFFLIPFSVLSSDYRQGTKRIAKGAIELQDNSIIVSLTSHGNRVNGIAHLAIENILESKTSIPFLVILWLDKDQWAQQETPELDKLAKKYDNFYIGYTKDIGPYTKIIPALRNFNDRIIITIDDDVIYDDDLLENLYQTHKRYEKKGKVGIVGGRVSLIPIINGKNEKFIKYKKSGPMVSNENQELFAEGVGGILYPPNSLHPDVMHAMDGEKFFSELKHHDDLWLYIMSKKQNTIIYSADQSTPCCNVLDKGIFRGMWGTNSCKIYDALFEKVWNHYNFFAVGNKIYIN